MNPSLNRRLLIALVRITFVSAISFAAMSCAPEERLTFPRSPVGESGNKIWYDVNGNGKPDFALIKGVEGKVEAIGYDDDEDGALDRIYRLSDYADDQVPHLILLLDSIPFQLAEERYQSGDFSWFHPPQKVICPFPSLTEPCYTELLHSPPLPGVIDQYYSWPQGKHNVLWDRVKGFEQPWERMLDYRAHFWEQGLSYLNPRPWHAADMPRICHAVDENPRRITIVYVGSASAMVCRLGRVGVEQIFDDVHQLCLQLLYERKGAIKISMMADHGHNLVPSQNVHLDEILASAGFRPRDKVESANDVVLEINGLVTYAGIHTQKPAQVADVLVKRPEVELAMYMQGQRVIVRSEKGAAQVDYKNGLVRYKAIDADVLDYQTVLDSLQGGKKLTADGFATDPDWFAATKDHYWPDAPRRIWDAFHGRAVNVPIVMLTMHDRYCAGLASYERMIDMASTHGGLNQINTATFVMSMMDRINHPMRTSEVMEALEPGYVVPVKR